MFRNAKNRNVIIIGMVVGVVALLGIIISLISYNLSRNPYGKSISINNYDAIVKNLSTEYKNSITASLYNVVERNSSAETASSVRDAYIRSDSAEQEVVKPNEQYAGSFIVDIESIKQSYFVQYAYSVNAMDSIKSGYPILVSCLPKDKLIYGDFSCKNVHDSESENSSDPIIDMLPKTTLSYKLYADTTSGKLLLKAELRIPSSDLAGADQATRLQVINLYKNEVKIWMKNNGFDPSKYTIVYNYDETGKQITLN